jgi:hypothetical protein
MAEVVPPGRRGEYDGTRGVRFGSPCDGALDPRLRGDDDALLSEDFDAAEIDGVAF